MFHNFQAAEPEITDADHHYNDDTEARIHKFEFGRLKSQADQLATELAQEKIRLSRYRALLSNQEAKRKNRESILNHLLFSDGCKGDNTLDLTDKRIIMIGGSSAQGRALSYYVEALGGQLSFIAGNEPNECFSAHTEESIPLTKLDSMMMDADLVLFLVSAFSDKDLSNTMSVCRRHQARFMLLANARISAFSAKLCAVFAS